MAAVPHFFGTSTSAFTHAEKVVYESPWWQAPPAAVDHVGSALAAAGALADNVSDATKHTARALLLLLSSKHVPQITVEETGEISFEWYKDNQHVAVLTIDGQHVRWAAMLDAHTPTSGVQLFANVVPTPALTAIDAAI